MKILSTESYNNLIEEIEIKKQELASLQSSYEGACMEIMENKRRFSLNLSVKRFIIGRRGSGKTVFLQKVIIPKLMGNYFLIDLNNEYDLVSPIKKYVVEKHLSTKQLIQKLVDIFNQHSSKVIIVEDAMIYGDLSWLCKTSSTRQFIVVTHNANSIAKYIGLADFVYDFGSDDYNQRNTDLLNDFEMQKFIPMNLDMVIKEKIEFA